MQYTITKVESKNNDWKLVWGQGLDGSILNGASINRTDRKTNAPFPNFDGIVENSTVEGNVWANPEGKQYLFPPKPRTEPKTTRKSFDATAAVAMKQEGIKASQDRKDESIKISSTARDATAIMVALMQKEDFDYQEKWLEIREWLWNNWEYLGDEPLQPDQIPF